MTIDISSLEAQALIRDLACKADVLLENFKVGGLRQYGLDAEALLQLNPRLVYASITGFGQDGPYAARAGYDFLNQAANYLIGDMVPERMGNAHPNIVPYQDFPTADGDMILAIGNDTQFARFCEIAGHPEWASDERFASNRGRVENRAVLLPLLRQATVFRTTRDWMEALERASVPCGPINRIDQVFDDPQVKARELCVKLPHPLAGEVPLVANPIRLSGSPIEYRRAPPLLGQHTDEVLADWLGLDASALQRLKDGCII
ncbi:CoA transferase [Noviherbaspirillum sp. 17J57-3]|uniref:CoA transferase n=1 Tax=Noviherbaspirillum galbum TaxID=2709383 RepID=A0A6B3SIX3_9BURK|nr:CoA transferase [Noviherbaspirillum galbum]